MIKVINSKILINQSTKIFLSHGLLKSSKFKNFFLFQKKRLIIISDDKVRALYGQKLKNSLQDKAFDIHLFSFKEGEKNKTRKTKESLENQMLNKNLGSDSIIIALGGGVITDITGFIASTYCRGVSLVMIPTSLTSMIDASLGGKNGVNTKKGKNLIGSYYQPEAIFIDFDFLKTLDAKEIKNGLFEMIKHALISDERYFSFLEKNIQKILTLDPKTIEYAIYQSVSIKQNIVRVDIKGKTKRHLLNFGHTIAHAIELLSEYKISHGKAVALGILTESYLSVLMKVLAKKDFLRIFNILKKLLKSESDIFLNFSALELIKALSLDKKTIKNIPRFVILKKIGKALHFSNQYCTSIDKTLLMNALKWLFDEII